MCQKYVVRIEAEERIYPQAFIAVGAAPDRKLAKPCILLKSDLGPQEPGWIDACVAEAVGH